MSKVHNFTQPLPCEVVREQYLLRRQMIQDVSKNVYNVITKIIIIIIIKSLKKNQPQAE